MKVKNKYRYIIMLQEFVGGYGWADVGEEDTRKEARATAKDYRNEGIATRIISRRVLND